MAKAGSAFESITLNGRNFSCDSESEPEVDLSEYTNETAANTDGTFRIKKTRKVQSISNVEITVDPALGDLIFINDLQKKLEPFSFMATRLDGGVYSGEVTLVDDVKYKEKDGTIELSIEGRIEML
ncbi:MAG: hypothetical protein IJ191_03965 [Treponema sp.]|nr:hypothetical protein [Treponema sp.]